MRVTRRSSRGRNAKNSSTTNDDDSHDAKVTVVSDDADIQSNDNDMNSSDDESVDNEGSKYNLNGVSYSSYQEMVDAKRRRNEEFLQQSGLLEAAHVLSSQSIKPKKKAGRGLVANNKRKSEEPLVRRKSRRLLGVAADGKYVENESAKKFTIAGGDSAMTPDVTNSSMSLYESKPRFYGNRINDGSSITLKEAIENSESKYQTSIEDAESFFRSKFIKREAMTKKNTFSEEKLRKEIENLSVDDENCVAKVVPERSYTVAFHPSENDLIVAAGDKAGHVGLWHVDSKKDSDDDSAAVYLFRYHTSVVSNLEWNKKNQLVSFSYDGTVRVLDVATEKATEVFATYDDSDEYKKKLGYSLDTGYKCWTQYGCLDHRNNDCIFLSSSRGTAMHLDLRCQKLTFHEELSEKKINTLSLHPNGHSLISAGLDCTVQLWDIRKFGNKKKKAVSPVAMYHGGKSINGAFFSPTTGSNVVCTTMNNKLDILQDFHLQSTSKNKYIKPSRSILHNNQTGRWLTTLMARFHPVYDDLFCVGCMKQPRQIEIFSASTGKLVRSISGESLSAVASRCNFHPTLPIVAGVNSSGRVTVAR